MKSRWILVLGALAALAVGAQELWEGILNRQPVKMSCAQFIAKPVSAKWLELTDCTINYLESVKTFKRKALVKTKVKDIGYYVPVRATAVDAQPVLLVMKAPDDVVKMLNSFEANATDLKSDATLRSQNGDRLVQQHVSVRGVVAFGLFDDVGHVRDLFKENPPEGWKFEPEWKIIDTSRELSVGYALFILLSGTAVLVWQWLSFRRRLTLAAAVSAAITAAESPERISDIAGR